MRAICVLKMLLLMGLVADASAAVAKEVAREVAREDVTRDPSVLSRTAQTGAVASTTVRAFHPERLQRMAAYPDLRLASLGMDEVLRADLFATDRSAAFAPPASTSGGLASDRLGSVLFDDQQRNAALRNIVLLQQRVAASHMRSASDFWLMALVGLMLVVYQLCRKHRFLRPQPFTL